jgi:hypothetical protein
MEEGNTGMMGQRQTNNDGQLKYLTNGFLVVSDVFLVFSQYSIIPTFHHSMLFD